MSKKEKIGIVISNKMEKSVVVAVDSNYRHPFYSKIIVKTKKYIAHDENNLCEIGDQVRLEESRPLSKKKRWIVKKILIKSNQTNL
jgi:small subunit ribosomal protein S17